MLPNPLNITDTKNVSPINRYAREVNASLDEIHSQLKRQNSEIKDAAAAAAAAGSSAGGMALAPNVTGVSASESGYIIDGVLYSEVTCNYTAPNPLGTFAGVFLVIKNYRGSAELVKVTEHNYTGIAGGTAHFKVTLQRTGETVTLYFVSTNADNATVADWSTAPSTTVALDGNASAPNAPTSFTGTAQQLGVLLTWDENLEDNLKSYNVWRNVTNNPATADNMAVVASNGLGTGKATYFDKETFLGTTYWYWVTAVNNAQLESTKAGPVSLTADTISLEDEVVDGPTRGAITAANTSYRPLTNPLTAHDNGVSAEIDIASFTMRVANGHDVSLNSGVISGLSYNTTYHVYYDDPSYAGGAVTYFANTDQAISLDATGRFYVGSILTPVAGGADTTGNNDGGTGAQSGQLYLLSPSLRADDSTDPVTWYPSNDLDSDGDTSTFVSITTELISWLGGFPQITSKWKSLKLKVHSAVPNVIQGGTAFVDYSLDDGTTWTSIYSVVNGTDAIGLATAAVNDGGAGTAWTNPGNLADPSNFATITGAAHGAVSQYDKATGCGFAIPSGATIVGIQAKCDEVIGGTATETPQLVFRLLKAGTPVGNTRTVNAPATGTVTAGADDDLWNTTWAYSDINDPNFGVEIAASAPVAASSWVSSTYYSPLGVIIDTNGNLQQIATPGISGGSAPAWGFTLTSVANHSGSSTVYTGTITGGGSNAFAGKTFSITGFTNSANNGDFVCTASTATTLTLSNSAGTAETHAAVASILNGTTTDGSVVWTMIQTKASLVWTAGHTYSAGSFIKVSVSGTDHLFQLDSAGPAMPLLAAGCKAYGWSPGGSHNGQFDKTYPSGAGDFNFNVTSLHWDNSGSGNLLMSTVNGDGTLGSTTSTGHASGWECAIVGQLYFPRAGQYTFLLRNDDGAYLGFQSGITKVSGTYNNPRGQTRTAKQGYVPVCGANGGGNYLDQCVINVPTAGLWGFEIDYCNYLNAGTMILTVKDSGGTAREIISQATTLKSGASSPTFPTWSTGFAPSYPSAIESGGNYVWFNRGPATDFSWQALTSFTAAGLKIIDDNLNGELAYRAGLSNAGPHPTWATTLNGLTTDGASLIWIETGPISTSTTFDFSIRNAVIQVTYVASGSPSSRAITTDSVTLPITQNLGRVQVRYGFVTQAGEMDMYEVWIEAQAG